MPIHDCPHSFEVLATTVLPAHMDRLNVSLAAPLPMLLFARSGAGVQTILKQLDLSQDFSGSYVLIEGQTPIYVGISRSVIARLRQHVFGKTHFDASLAFRIGLSRHPDRTIEALKRSEAMSDELFGTSFEEAQSYLRSLHVATVEIQNPLELYVFEPYCAMRLDTHQWNSFETH